MGINYTTYRFSLDVHSHRSQAMVKTFQGNTAVKLIITLTEGGNVYKLDPGNIALLTATRPDDVKLAHICTVSDGRIEYTFSTETTAADGYMECDVTVYSSSGDVKIETDSDGKVNVTANPAGVLTAAKFAIDIYEREMSGDEPVISNTNDAIDTVLGAAAAEWAREQAENAREDNEVVRQESYDNAIATAEEAKKIVPLVVDESLTLSNTHDSLKKGYKNLIDLPSLNKMPKKDDKFWGICKSTDNYVYSFVAKITGNFPGDYAEFEFDEVTLLHDGDAHKRMRLDYDSSSHIIKIVSTDVDGNKYESKGIDLPLESAITNIEESKNASGQPILIFTLQNGSKTEVLLDDVFDIVKGNKQYIENVERIANGNKTDISALDDRLYNNEQYTEGLNQWLNNLTDSGYGLIPQLERTKADKSVVESISEEVTDHEERIEQLESLSLRYIEDTSVWHTKDVPSDVGKKALVDMIGGMSYTSNNKLPFPYPNMYDNEQNGVSVTYNKDGSITLNGVLKAPNQIDILLYEDYSNPLSVDGVFTIGVDLPEACSFLSICELSDDGLFDNPEQFDYPQEVEASLMWKFHYLQISFGAWAEKDVTFDNYTFYPMFNEGRTPLKFEPYIKGVKHAKVKAIRSMVDGKVLSSVEVPKEIYDRADWGLGVSDKIYNFIDLNNDTYLSKCAICTFDGSEDWKEKPATGKIRFMTNLNGCASPYIEGTKTATPAVANYYTSVSASKNLNQHNKSYTFGSNSFFVFDKDIQDLNSWIEHLKNNPLTVVYEKADVDYVKLDNFPQEAKALVMDTSKGKLVADNDENLPAPSTITYITHRGL